MTTPEFAAAGPAEALALRNTILAVDSETWDLTMPDEIASPEHAPLSTWDPIDPNGLSEVTRRRLHITPESSDGNYELLVARRWHPDGWGKRGGEQFVDYGPDAAFVRLSRVNMAKRIRVASFYTLNVTESYNADQPPLCELSVRTSDEAGYYDLLDMLNEGGGSLADVARAMGIDPLKDMDDQAPPNIYIPNADFEIALRMQLTGEAPSEEEAAAIPTQARGPKGLT